MKKTDISIIVAAYNAEQTLGRCLDSILAQTKSEFEVVLVDDGSSDGTGQLCDSYSAKDNRIRSFHNTNHGIGYTRQFGLEHSIGEYVIHIDSDDWVEPDFLMLLYQKAVSDNSDMVICDILENYGTYSKVLEQHPSGLDRESLLLDVMADNLQCGPCNKLVRKQCIEALNIGFPQNLNYGEDFVFVAGLLNAGISVSFVSEALYHYEICSNPDSASKKTGRAMHGQKEAVARILRETITGKEFDSTHNCRLVSLAYYAIRNGVYSKSEYFEKYKSIAHLGWNEYSKLAPIAFRIVVWCSFHISYGSARAAMHVKEFIRSIRTIFKKER